MIFLFSYAKGTVGVKHQPLHTSLNLTLTTFIKVYKHSRLFNNVYYDIHHLPLVTSFIN